MLRDSGTYVEMGHFVDLANYLVGQSCESVYARFLANDTDIDDSMLAILNSIFIMGSAFSSMCKDTGCIFCCGDPTRIPSLLSCKTGSSTFLLTSTGTTFTSTGVLIVT